MQTDRYKIKKIVGEGGTSTVYLAHDTLEKCDVAIKSQILDSSGSNYNKEYEMLSRIKHEHVIEFKNFLSSENRSYLVTEACDYNLIYFINNYEVDTRSIKKITRMILLGIRYLHSQGIIHRDIKLGNILIKDDTIKICDLGLSCYENENDFGFCGTMDYLAPEMKALPKANAYTNKSNIKYDNKIDIYAAGVVFKVLITKKKDISINDINNVDINIINFLKRLLKNEPESRPSAEEALKNQIFQELFTEIPDFRLCKNFIKKNKYGEISRSDKFAQIKYSFNNELFNLKIEYSGIYCNCKGAFIPRVIFNGDVIEKEFLTNTHLKYFNYLCSYLKIVSEKTPIIDIIHDNMQFNYFSNGSCQLIYKGVKIYKNIVKKCYLIDGRLVDIIPTDCAKIMADLERRCLLMRSNECICSNSCIDDTKSTINLSINKLGISQIENCKIINSEYKFILNYGWCIKTGMDFLFLLNNGLRFSLQATRQKVIIEGNSFNIDKKANIEVLEIMRVFLEEFVNN